MAWYYGNYGEPVYVSNGDPRFHGGDSGIFYQVDPAPVSFRMPPFYSDAVYYRRSFRDQHPHFGHGGELIIPAREQVHIRREDPYPHPYYPYPSTTTAPWWLDDDVRVDYPHDGGVHPGGVWVVERRRRPHGDDDDDCNLEFYAPQLCSDSRARKVVDALKALPGVVHVVADQWQMKVVVVGRGLCEEQVLRRLRRVKHMDRSILWRDRR